MKGILLSIISALLVLAACNQVNQSQIDQVEQLRPKLDSIAFYLNQADTTELGQLYTEASNNLKYLNQNLKSDSLTMKEGAFFSDYRANRKKLKRVLQKHSTCTRELKKSIRQADALIKDINQNQLDDAQFASYFSTEQEVANKLLSDAKFILESSLTATVRHNEKNPGILEWVEKVELAMANQ